MLNQLASLKLTKVNIEGYKKYEKKKFGEKIGTMPLQVNPERIGRKLGVSVGSGKKKGDDKLEKGKFSDSAIGIYKEQHSYKNTKNESLDFSFYLDATGVIPGCDSVVESLQKFSEIAYSYVNTKHRTPIVKLVWGKTFKSLDNIKDDVPFQLTNYSVNYTLFKYDGTPLRAEVQVSFEEYIESELKERSSPDMTHIRTVKPGFNLVMMCQEVYDDPGYYLEVARYNGLSSVFDIHPGQKLYFPPIQK